MSIINTVRRKKSQSKSCFLDLLRIIKLIHSFWTIVIENVAQNKVCFAFNLSTEILQIWFFLGNVQPQLTYFFLLPVSRWKKDPELSRLFGVFFLHSCRGWITIFAVKLPGILFISCRAEKDSSWLSSDSLPVQRGPQPKTWPGPRALKLEFQKKPPLTLTPTSTPVWNSLQSAWARMYWRAHSNGP